MTKAKGLTKDRREEEVIDMADRVREMVENFANDLRRDSGVEFSKADRIGWEGVRLALRELRASQGKDKA